MNSNDTEAREFCTCVMPFCGEDHKFVIPTGVALEEPDDLDDWEGPPSPEYSEYDAESFDEMIRDYMRGAF